jgi:hypothetical protein
VGVEAAVVVEDEYWDGDGCVFEIEACDDAGGSAEAV